jgi:hypothetical protein
MQSDIVRAGRGAAKITLREGDHQEANERGGPLLERAELQEATGLWSVEDQTYTYSFSVYLPKDFPVVPTRLVIAQWKQKCPVDACDPPGPLVAVRYSAGELRITRGPDSTTLYRTSEEARGRWLDFRFAIRFSPSPGGRIQAWLNDQPVVDHSGVTAYRNGGYPARNLFYFKMGLYRDRMAQPMTIYIDEYRKAPLSGGGL